MSTLSFRHISIALTLLLFCVQAGWTAPINPVEEHQHAHSGEVSAETSETVWTCSMHPQIQLPEPGQCPICFMDLIEVKKETGGDRQSLRQISFDDRARRLAQVEVEKVRRGKAATEIQMVGKVDYDETRVGAITSWVNGRIDKLLVDYTGSRVRRGQPMVKVYSPELLTAQAELIEASAALKRTEQSGNEIIKKTASRTLEASREKLRLLGLSESQIKLIEKRGTPSEHITLTAPLSGIVIQKKVNEGMYVKTGSLIYTLADLKRVWVILEAYESELGAITLGQQVNFTVESYPGTSFHGEVAYIDPLVNPKTRTIRVRLNVDNSDEKLKPGMFVRATASGRVATDSEELPLLIPASAPLITGKRALVYVQPPEQEGVYIGREVVLGPRRGDFYQVKSGLQEGELVVTRGNFKIDSAIQIQGRPSLMNPYHEKQVESEKTYPPLFISKLNLLNHTFAEFSKGVHERDTGLQKQTLTKLAENIDTIKDDDLANEDKLSWQELAMLLKSDIILLEEAESSGETEQLYATTAEHFQQLRHRFELEDSAAARLGSDELREEITHFLTSYLKLQQLLAADNLDDATGEKAGLSAQADKVITALHASGFDQGSTLANELEKNIGQLMESSTLDSIRSAFYPLSVTIAEVVNTFGSNSPTPLYLQFCPMAFDNKGATWISNSEEINNPYFGAMMLRCGEVRQQLTQ